MSEENLEDWDTDFLEEAIKVEEQHLSSQYIPTTTTSFDKPPRFEQSSSAAFVRNDIMSYSPPRELSQTTAAYSMPILDRASNGIGLHSSPLRRSDNTKDREIERLKKELGRVSKQLTELEHECFELRKGRDKEQHKKSILFKNNEQDGNAENSKKANMECAPTAVHEKLQLECQNVKGYDKLQQECPNLKGSDNQLCTWIHKDNSSCQEIGVQTDLPVRLDLSTKLQGIWGLIRDQNTGRTLISKLLVDCPTDFNILFGYARLSTSLKAVDTLAVENSLEKEHASEAAKASNFFCVVMKISNGMLQLEAMLEPLLDLCNANNDVIVHKSLCILHKLLNNLLALERRSEVRNNVIVEELHSVTSTDHFHGFESIKRSNCIGSEGACNASDFSFGVWPNAETSYKKRSWEIGNAAIPLYFVDWISLFESIHQIALRSTEEHVRLEALSIMNVILMRTNASTEREMFGHKKIFEGIALLLSKETGLCVRKEAVRLLYLLLNCPKLLVMFSSGYKGENPSAEDDREESASAFKGFDMILEGFADCLASSSNSVEELDLCRNVIIVLAFLASSGKFGFEILVVHKLSRDRNFLLLILQMLISETDMESTLQSECAGIFEKRTLLMREALILLNRLASNPVSSATVLRMLTNSRDMASLTVDVAKRLSRKEQVLQGSDAASQKIRESEIIDLARAFKKRIFNFLGDSLS